MSDNTVFPGGVNTPDYRHDHSPTGIVDGNGAVVRTERGDELIDLSMAYGSQIFGHSPSEVEAVAKDVLGQGWLFAEPHTLVSDVAEQVCDTFPCADTVKFATTGSDAVSYSLRCARSYTGRNEVLVTNGSYHGVHDGLAYSSGFLEEVTEAISSVPFNDVKATREALKSEAYAAFLLEPVLKDSGCVEPSSEYLEAVREICSETGTVLVFDEVLTGARLERGGAQSRYGITPDLMTASKALSAGLPLSVVAGRNEFMDEFMPAGDVFLAGTFNANPLGLAAANVTLDRIRTEPVHEQLGSLGTELRHFLTSELADRDIEATVQGVGSITSIAFDHTGDEYMRGLRDTEYSAEQYYEFASVAREAGLLLPPYHFQSLFVSLAHRNQFEEMKRRFRMALDAYADD